MTGRSHPLPRGTTVANRLLWTVICCIAGLQPARRSREDRRASKKSRPADYKSAIQQIENLATAVAASTRLFHAVTSGQPRCFDKTPDCRAPGVEAGRRADLL